jgi:hypothetical protein
LIFVLENALRFSGVVVLARDTQTPSDSGG